MCVVTSEVLEPRRLLSGNVVNGGDLDPSFGDGGRVVVDVAPRADRLNDMVRLPDGDLLMLGLHTESDPSGYGLAYAAVTRLNADGSRDATFGAEGVARLSDSVVGGASLIVTNDGKILIAGIGRGDGTATAQGIYDLALQRLNSDGSIDMTFGGDGMVTTDVAGREDIAAEVLQQPDGRLVVVGYEQRAFMSRVMQRPHVVLARYEMDGLPDVTFGQNGIVLTDLPTYGVERASGAALQPDGGIVVAGTVEQEEGHGASSLMAMRYTSDGSPDASFGKEGVIVTRFSGWASGVQLTDDGRILLGGTNVRGGGVTLLAAVRLKQNGTIDRRFGRGGIAAADFLPLTIEEAGDTTTAIVLQPDGRPIVVGHANGFAIARFTRGGQPDTTFGWHGRAYHELVAANQVNAAVQPDGKILLAGAAGNDILLERVFGDNVPAFAKLRGRTVTVEGTEMADRVVIADPPPPAPRVFSITVNGYEQRFAREEVDRVVVRTRDGNDEVRVEGQFTPVTVFGGRGDDVLFGAAGDDKLEGEEGDDRLTGGAGRDLLAGGRGNDSLDGADGERDELFGGAGVDTAILDAADRAKGIEQH
jgi:uncharacterized delta-60 repeat protein